MRIVGGWVSHKAAAPLPATKSCKIMLQNELLLAQVGGVYTWVGCIKKKGNK